MEYYCPVCKSAFIKKRKEQKYCCRKCVYLARETPKVCPICKKKFQSKRFSHTYCSRKCSDTARITKSCFKCGKAEIDPRSSRPGYPKFCKLCFEIWRKNRNKIRVECRRCGKIKIVKYHIAKKERPNFICRNCKKLKNCHFCGKIFQPKSSRVKYCSRECIHKHRRRKSICVICGEMLNYKTHTSTHQKCDACMYFTRKVYKTKSRFGLDKTTAEKIVMIDILSGTGLLELKTSQRKEVLCENQKKMAEKLLHLNR